MKITLNVPTDKDARFLRIQAPVNYGTEDIPQDTPGRQGDMVDWLLDLDQDVVVGWSFREPIDLYMKVVDQGTYALLDADQQVIIAQEQEYVPSGIGEYGDYLKFRIGTDGKVSGWNKDKLIRHFQSVANNEEE